MQSAVLQSDETEAVAFGLVFSMAMTTANFGKSRERIARICLYSYKDHMAPFAKATPSHPAATGMKHRNGASSEALHGIVRYKNDRRASTTEGRCAALLREQEETDDAGKKLAGGKRARDHALSYFHPLPFLTGSVLRSGSLLPAQ